MPGGEGVRGRGGVYVVKLGGSIVTIKDKPFYPNIGLVRSVASVLAKLYRERRLAGVVVGGGSYGHYVAGEYKGFDGPEALTTISRAMEELAGLVADLLAEAGIYTLSFPPHAICKPSGLKPNCSWELARKALQYNIVPLSYGDVYPCSKGFCIVSGDEIVMEMACSLNADNVVYITSVGGVLKSGKVINVLRLEEARKIISSKAEGFDVTGGMLRKLSAIEANWCKGLKRVVIAPAEPSALLRVVEGERAGTEILP